MQKSTEDSPRRHKDTKIIRAKEHRSQVTGGGRFQVSRESEHKDSRASGEVFCEEMEI